MAVPVTLITGFLGAGKTSLLNHLLADAGGARIAVVVNDFGAVNIDAQLIERRDGGIVELQNGCICCSLSDGLVATVASLLRRPVPPEHIVVETSGLSDPIEIARALADTELQAHAPLDGVITLVDAQQAASLEGASLALARRQVAAADLVLLNKVDGLDAPALQRARSWVLAHAPAVRIVHTVQARIPALAILGLGGSGLAPGDHAAAVHDASAFESLTLECSEPIALARLHALLGAMPRTLLRVKGVLDVQEKPGWRCILQATPRGATLTVGAAWAGQAPCSQIVFIGLKGSIDAAYIRDALQPGAFTLRKRLGRKAGKAAVLAR
jgi:G3E family GTPase